MNYDEFIQMIMESYPSDWNYDDDFGLCIYRNNINISILSDRSWPDERDEEFGEQWAHSFFNNRPYKKRYLLMYNGNMVEAFYGVDIDGIRSFIPYPRIFDMTITRKQYAIGNLINACIPHYRDFDDYLRQVNITVLED
jgi:hypothetical protein